MIENTQLMLNPINQYFGKLTNDIFNVNLNVWKQPFFPRKFAMRVMMPLRTFE